MLSKLFLILNPYKNTKVKSILLFCSIVLSLIISGCSIDEMLGYSDTKVYECTDTERYGDFSGNVDDQFPQQFIGSFFPNEIRGDFSNVVYSYRTMKWDEYRFEAYLEFHIQDKKAYQDYISSIGNSDQWTTFRFDTSYKEYVISDDYELSEFQGVVAVDYARIGKVLCNDAEQTVIYVAIAAPRCCPFDPDYFRTYFDRFDIEPTKYKA